MLSRQSVAIRVFGAKHNKHVAVWVVRMPHYNNGSERSWMAWPSSGADGRHGRDYSRGTTVEEMRMANDLGAIFNATLDVRATEPDRRSR